MKTIVKWIVAVLFIWIVLTVWVEKEGPPDKWNMGNLNASKKALILYDPDPFYNLDQQICESIGSVLSNHDYNVTIATVSGIKDTKTNDYQLYVFCANTYNWQPDWAICKAISKMTIADKETIAITVGAGSTKHSQKVFEKLIKSKKANLLDSKSFWIWKPNDEARTKQSNVKMAVQISKEWATKIVRNKNQKMIFP
jgi:hypothetical protein